MQPLADLAAHDMARVNELILSRAGSDIPLISQIASHLIASGGKRMRPMLTLVSSHMFGYEGKEHIQLAAGVEFMHTATLLHDDVVDESNLRRGSCTARMIWGNQASVLVGDYLLGQAFRMMVDAGSMEALRLLSFVASVIARGEIMQLSCAHNLETTEEEYFAIIESKTAALFSAATEIGPLIACAPESHRAAMRAYGLNLGLTFQLIDDALDYGGLSSQLGKNTGDDFREGKVTLPVILAYSRATGPEKAFWKSAIENQITKDDALAHALKLLGKHDAVDNTVARARHFANMAHNALACFPDSLQKSALSRIIDFCINRVF